MLNVKDYGAIGDGVTDNSAAIQAALSTGQHVLIPTGDYLINNPLTFTQPGQMISGDGRTQSRLLINPTFNLASQGVLIFACGEEGPQLENFGMVFAQPDTGDWSQLIQYPVAIYAVNIPRFTLSSLKITKAINGIDMTGNSGGAFIELLEMSAFGTGITIDGSLDTVRVNQFHFWCFDMTQGQTGIFFGVARAMDVGRVDSLVLHEFLNISSLGLNLRSGATGDPWVYMSDSGFDTFNGIRMSAGSLQVANSYITLANTPTLRGVHQTGGNLQFTNCYFTSSQTQPFMLMENMTGGALQIDNCFFNCASSAQFSVGGNMSNNSIQVSNCKFQAQTNAFQLLSAAPGTNKIHMSNNIIETAPIPYSQPIVLVTGSNRVYMTGNRVNDGSGTFIYITDDSPNWISGNIGEGWTYVFPTVKNGFYSNNLW
tara:strand:+ start:7060 stop:8343 length:1284 start_codon:yes stop_codon:yes gene_type:complete